MKLAIVLFNLGGPDSPEAVEPFLRNLFSDKAIISLPALFRVPLARFIAARRAPLAREIYGRIGGRSPIVPETEEQGRALETTLAAQGIAAKTFIAMRYWHPMSDAAARAVAAWNPDRVVLLPLYPQHSTTTTASSLDAWQNAARAAGLSVPVSRICCYPDEEGFIAAQADAIAEAFTRRMPGVDYRLLLSAHGLPKRTVEAGDPYQWQVEKTAEAIVEKLGIDGLDWNVCYQSRVGPLEWIGPATDAEIRRAGAGQKGVIIAPIAFVSEHSETLVELDIEYAKLAHEAGVADYVRVKAVGTAPEFIAGLARLVARAITTKGPVNCAAGRICPAKFSGCGWEKVA
ncbi:MAG: ferrochelatase [Alphaproteobacteria bacterium]|nr:ferrochelatase [Alphaproteobacteria bacterium]